MKTLIRVAVFILVIFSLSCGPSKREQLSKDILSLRNANPITIPIQFIYGPENLTYRLETLFSITVDEEKVETTNVTEVAVKAVLDPDDPNKMLWDYTLIRFTAPGVDSSKIPPINFLLITDCQGAIEKTEIKTDDNFNGGAIAKAVYKKLMEKDSKKIADQLKNSIATYPKAPAKTGDTLSTISSKSLIEPYENMLQLKPSSSNDKNVSLILRGWTFFENRQYYLTLADDKMIFEYPSDNCLLEMVVSEFQLIDPKSFHIIKDVRKIEISGNQSPKFKKKFKLEIWQDLKAVPSTGQN
jgi:hypothetical protein